MTTDRGTGALADLTIEPLMPENRPAVRAIYAEGIATGHATFEAEPPSWDAFDAGRLREHRLVARHAGGRTLGWAAVALTSTRPVSAGVVEHSVYVAAAGRGRGIGRLLLDELITSTEAAGIWTLQASVFPENVASRRLHEAAGFRVVGTRERVARMPCGPLRGRWRDTVVLERRSTVVG